MPGYFPFTAYFLSRIDPAGTQIFARFGLGAITLSYAAMLTGSALWMPLTLAVLAEPRDGLWVLVRAALAMVALASLGLLAALLTADVDRTTWFYRIAVLGVVAFCIQTVLLDGIAWPALFPR